MSDRRALMTYYRLCDVVGVTPQSDPTPNERAVMLRRAETKADALSKLIAAESANLKSAPSCAGVSPPT